MGNGAKLAIIVVLLILAGWLFWARAGKYISPGGGAPPPEELMDGQMPGAPPMAPMGQEE